MMKKQRRIEKYLNWEPNFKNEIDIEDNEFTITIRKDKMQIECNWDYGYGGRGSEHFSINLQELKQLIK